MNQSTKLLYLLFFSSILLFSGCSQEKKSVAKRETPPLAVNTITLKKEFVPIWKQYTGMTKASSNQDVKARVSGVLEAIYFHDGEYVKKGEKLFKIEDDEYRAALNAAKAKKEQDKAALTLAIADVNRYRPLVEEGLAPRATLEQYQAQQAGLNAAIAGDAANITRAEIELSYTVIKAPISGKVSARYVDVGNLVGQGEATLLTTIVSDDPIYAYFSPSQEDVRLFQKYQDREKSPLYIEVAGAKDKIRLDGYLDFSNNSVDPLTSTITMRATLKNSDKKVLPGTFVYINAFITDSYKFLMIPPEAIFSDQLGKYVYIVDENSSAKRVDITTDYSSQYYTSVNKGLKDGDRLIISSLIKLKEGRKVVANDLTQTKGIQAILKEHQLTPKVQ